MGAAILGLGHHLPDAVERAGVRRPIAVEAVGPSHLAVHAATGALAQADTPADAVDFIIFATMTPDVTFPGAGCFFQPQMGCGTVGALDVRAQCAGFVFGLAIADSFVRAGTYQRVLVIGAEVHSSGLDYESEAGMRVARLYGDGAGVALLGPTNDGDGILSVVIHSDGQHHRRFWCEYPASRQHPVRMTVDDFRRGRHFPVIDLDAVRRFGEESLPAAITEALTAAGLKPDQVDHFIISHVVPEVAERVGVRLGIGSRLIDAGRAHGHLTAGSLPVALSEAVAAGRIGANATVCLAASGAGFAWGAAVIRLAAKS